MLDEKDQEICISYYEGRAMWQATVKIHMIPAHGTITALESTLADRAGSVGGEADGWGCMSVRRNQS